MFERAVKFRLQAFRGAGRPPFAVAGKLLTAPRRQTRRASDRKSAQVRSRPRRLSRRFQRLGAKRGRKRTGAYQSLTFDTLASFRIKEPNWGRMDDPAYIATLNRDEGIPLQIKVLNGAKIEIEGFMFPLEGEVDNLQLLCCLKTKWRAVSVPFRCLMSGCMLRVLKKRESAAIKMIW